MVLSSHTSWSAGAERALTLAHLRARRFATAGAGSKSKARRLGTGSTQLSQLLSHFRQSAAAAAPSATTFALVAALSRFSFRKETHSCT